VGDPDFVNVPTRCLLSQSFADGRGALISDTALPTPQNAGTCPAEASASGAEEGPSTTHLTVADNRGNVVSYTFTIEQTGGSGIVVPNRGFLLNNELTDFEPTTGLPNSPAARKRPRSSMSPTILTRGRNNRPVLAVGSPGGATIITTVLQILMNRLDLGMTLPQAIAAPRASQRNAATTDVEQAFIEQGPIAEPLAALGEKYAKPAEIGAATGIEFLAGGRTLAAAEPVRRGGGSAMVVRSG
jgi:gamma-glutamyltranspeptidase / glutathione hydrolase